MLVRPHRPYQFNCTFTAWHPDTGGANGSESERQAARRFYLVRKTRAHVLGRITVVCASRSTYIMPGPGRRVVPSRGRWLLPVVCGLTRRLCSAAAGIRPVTARTMQGMALCPGQARCLAFGFWPANRPLPLISTGSIPAYIPRPAASGRLCWLWLHSPDTSQGRRSVPELVFLVVAGVGFEPTQAEPTVLKPYHPGQALCN